MLMGVLGRVLLGNTFLAGVIISNACLILTCIFLYKLVLLESDRKTALRSVKYLFLFPTAFILSAVLSDSLFLALLVSCFYYARKGNWFFSGVLGFLLSLTRSIGVFMVVPLLIEYLRVKKFNPRTISIHELKKIDRNILFLLLLPAGLTVFSVYNYYLTGDFFGFATIRR